MRERQLLLDPQQEYDAGFLGVVRNGAGADDGPVAGEMSRIGTGERLMIAKRTFF